MAEKNAKENIFGMKGDAEASEKETEADSDRTLQHSFRGDEAHLPDAPMRGDGDNVAGERNTEFDEPRTPPRYSGMSRGQPGYDHLQALRGRGVMWSPSDNLMSPVSRMLSRPRGLRIPRLFLSKGRVAMRSGFDAEAVSRNAEPANSDPEVKDDQNKKDGKGDTQ